MFSLIALTLVPVAFVIVMGWSAGKWKILDANQNCLLAGFVVQFALPAALFLGAAQAPPAEIEDWGFLLGLALGLIVIYLLGLALAVAVFGHNLAEGALQALSISFPNMAAVGIPILGALIGPSSLLSVLLGNLVSSLVIVPVTLTLLEAGRGEKRGFRTIWPSLLNSLRKPLVWAPVAGLMLAFGGVRLPVVVDRSLEMIGGVTAGVSLFSLGLLLSQQAIRLTWEVLGNVMLKLLAQPALMALLATVLAVQGDAGRELIVLGALPTASIAAMLAMQYKAYTAESSATVLLSTALSVPTLAGVIALVN